MSKRSGFGGETLKLRALFKDDLGDNATASSVFVHIFEPDSDLSDLNNALVASGVPTYLGQGIYEYEFSVPNTGPEGQWYDVWEGVINNQNLVANLSFAVEVSGFIEPFDCQLFENDIVTVTLPSGIQAADQTELSDEFVFEFMVKTNPSYTSVRKVRLEVGGFLADVPDYTLQMGILDASIEADAMTFVETSQIINNKLFQHARREYTTCVASSMLLTNLGNFLLRSKTLGDLSVSYDTNGIRDTMNKLQDCMQRWAGQLMAGGGMKRIAQPQGVVKGDMDPDRPTVARSWERTHTNDPVFEHSRGLPAANDKVQPSNSRRGKRSWFYPHTRGGSKKWW